MTWSTVEEYQGEMVRLLRSLFPRQEVQAEWSSIQSIDGIYSPRLDLAVGPFSVNRGEDKTAEYDAYITNHHKNIEHLIEYHRTFFEQHQTSDAEVRGYYEYPTIDTLKNHNRNARCFLAIEIENKVTRKHLLGGALNASALGRIGIIIPWTPKMANAMVRLLQYWSFLKSVGKNAFDAKNLIIVSPEHFKDAFAGDL